MTQCELIINHLKRHKVITSRDAMIEYGIMRLASRVNDLKKAGFPIVSEMVSGENKYGEAVRFAQYRLENEVSECQHKSLTEAT